MNDILQNEGGGEGSNILPSSFQTIDASFSPQDWIPIEQATGGHRDGRYLIGARFESDCEFLWLCAMRFVTQAQMMEESSWMDFDDAEDAWVDADDIENILSPTHFMPLLPPKFVEVGQ